MTLSSKHILVRMAYDGHPPSTASLCGMVQRVVWRGAVTGFWIAMIGFIVWQLYYDWLGYLWLLGMVGLALVAWGFIMKWLEEWFGVWMADKLMRLADRATRGAITVENSACMQWLHAIKHRVCPVITIERG